MKFVNEPAIFSNNFFTLRVTQDYSQTSIKMMVLKSKINTSYLPQTINILSGNLPKIFTHHCFNQDNNTFKDEARKTEIGHLFEHILLEHISELKNSDNNGAFIVEGKTNWDWQTDKVGIFHIKVNIGTEDEQILFNALEKSISLLKQIMRAKQSKNLGRGKLEPLNS